MTNEQNDTSRSTQNADPPFDKLGIAADEVLKGTAILGIAVYIFSSAISLFQTDLASVGFLSLTPAPYFLLVAAIVPTTMGIALIWAGLIRSFRLVFPREETFPEKVAWLLFSIFVVGTTGLLLQFFLTLSH